MFHDSISLCGVVSRTNIYTYALFVFLLINLLLHQGWGRVCGGGWGGGGGGGGGVDWHNECILMESVTRGTGLD